KRRLAREIVQRFYGAEGAMAAEAHFDRVHREREVPPDIPEVVLEPADLKEGRIWIAQLLVRAGLATSNSQARRLVAQGGVRIDGQVVTDPELDWLATGGAVVQVGKRRFVRIVLAR